MKKYILIGIFIFFICLFAIGKVSNEEKMIGSEEAVLPVIKNEKIENEEIKEIEGNVKNLLDQYLDLKKVLVKSSIDIPVKNKFIPQGITLVDEYILITGYYESEKNSKCYVIDKSGIIINTVTLDTNSHVGGISYDRKNDLIWIPDNDGVLNVYDADSFFKKKKVKAIKKFTNVGNGLIDYLDEEKKLIAYLAIDGEYLYVGNFYKTKKCIVKKYKILVDKKIRLEYVNKFLLPKKIQGLAFYEKNNKNYLIASSSFNRRTRSNIYIYEYDEKILDYESKLIKNIEIPPMAEQLTIKDDILYLIFESNASKYPNALDKVDKILEIDINRLIE